MVWKLYFTKMLPILMVLMCAVIVSANLPPDIKKCKAADVKCIADTINDVLRRYPKGNKEFGLDEVDSVHLKDVVVSQAASDTPVQLNLKFKTLVVNGFESARVDRVVGFEKDVNNSKFEVYGHTPELRMKGQYIVNGKVLILPITGEDNAEIIMKNSNFAFKLKVALVKRNGINYATIKQIKTITEPQSLKVQLDNLFNGNKELSDSTNKVINDNWKDIWAELQDGINKVSGDVIRKLIENVLKELPYDDFYKSD
ncbi:protein takeout-like [Teleopsis dalmanni]|uniref:protein takeout-like n=1 Tax=Teleopsis dalmanni TaxID=139649 RepID=UPI000D32C331|nr:protein takeout-like [Teleopsis dalmanni]XP_037954778.1 protein takeout-like [Teleopsis dalmanni]